MKKIMLSVVSISLLADGSAAIITKPSKDNPSPNGVHKVNAGQLARISTRALVFNSPVALKHLVDLGGTTLTIDAVVCKPGDVWENKSTGETGIYKGRVDAEGNLIGDGSWTKYSNHEVVLSFAAKMKLAELSISQGLNSVPSMIVAPQPRKEAVVATTTDDAGQTEESKEEEPNV